MNRAPSENLDNLLLALAKLEYRDFVGVEKGLAECLIKLFETMEAMLDLELKQRKFNAFMPTKKNPHKGDNGSWS